MRDHFTMVGRRGAILGGLLALATAGCGELADQLQAEDFAVAALIKLSDQENPKTHEVIPGGTSMTVFFGHIDKTKIIPKDSSGKQEAQSGAFTPNTGAKVKLEFVHPADGSQEITIPDLGGGKYMIDSSQA